MRYMVRFAVLATVSTLAACGGGGSGSSNGGSTTPPPGDPARVSFAEMRNGLLAIDRQVGEVSSVMAPRQGSATYNGYMTGGQNAEQAMLTPQYASRVQLKADFDRKAMDGRFYQFADSDNNRIQGELKLSNGKIDRDRFGADVSGRLTDRNGASISVSGETAGGFYNTGATAVAGALTVSSSASPDSGLVGGFVATKAR